MFSILFPEGKKKGLTIAEFDIETGSATKILNVLFLDRGQQLAVTSPVSPPNPLYILDVRTRFLGEPSLAYLT